MKYKAGERVVYKNVGVCQVVSVEEQSMDGENEVLYYKLKPVADANSTYYVPVASGEEKLRYLLSKEEVLELIDTMPKLEDEAKIWSNNRRERREMYTQILKGDDLKAIVQLISGLYFRKQATEARKKKFSSMDESVMKSAEGRMLQEFSIVLEIPLEDIRTFIDERVNRNTTE